MVVVVVVVEIIFVPTGQGGSNNQLVRFLKWGCDEFGLAEWEPKNCFLFSIFYFQYLEHEFEMLGVRKLLKWLPLFTPPRLSYVLLNFTSTPRQRMHGKLKSIYFHFLLLEALTIIFITIALSVQFCFA